jgi:hypothetical protein
MADHVERSRWALLLSILGCCAAAAQDSNQARLQSIINDPRLKQSVEGVAGHATVMVEQKCPTAAYAANGKFEIIQQPTFDAAGNPLSGAWKQVVDEQGCNASHLLNVFVRVKDGGGLAVSSLLPGTTHADPTVQKEALDKAVAAANSVPHSGDPDCRTGYVADTKFTAEQDAKDATGPEWREVWTLISCSRQFLVPMSFRTDQKGTIVAAGPTSRIKFYGLGSREVTGTFFEPTQSGH